MKISYIYKVDEKIYNSKKNLRIMLAKPKYELFFKKTYVNVARMFLERNMRYDLYALRKYNVIKREVVRKRHPHYDEVLRNLKKKIYSTRNRRNRIFMRLCKMRREKELSRLSQ